MQQTHSEAATPTLTPTVTLRAAALAYGGSFVCDLVDGPPALKGMKFFVRGVVPGEVFTAEIVAKHKSYIEARLQNLEDESGDRVEPECPYFNVCGGCDLQYMSIQAQRDAKREMVETTLSKHGGGIPINGVILIGQDLPAFNYRRRVALHVSETGQVGFYRQQTREVVPIAKCLLALPPINEALLQLNQINEELGKSVSQVQLDLHHDKVFAVFLLREDGNWKERLLSLTSKRFANMLLRYKRRTVYYQEDFKEVPNFVPAGHFSQVNQEANQILIERVVSSFKAPEITEFYGGSGNFSFPLAQAGKKIDVVEIDEALVKFGQDRASQLGLGANINFIKASAEAYLKRSKLHDSVLLDPPRSGALDVARKMPENVQQIVYVSCNLPSLCRDLKVLREHGLSLLSTEVLDMFPQTHHVETISRLERL